MGTSALPPSSFANANDIERVFAAQRAHAPAVRTASAEQRKDKLRRLCDGLRTYRSDLQDAIHADVRKAPAEVDLTELKPLLDEAEFAIAHLDDWMAPTRRSSPVFFTGTRSEVHAEPKGVVLILSPWNYPLVLTLGPLISAVAAGNCVTLKPSEKTPHTNTVLKQLIGELYEEREVALLTGATEVAQGLLEQPYDHVYFTGSPRVGRLVMKAAADHLASVTLELGGKSPAIVDETADLALAAERIAWSKCTNAGQTCIAPDYVRVDAPVHDALVARLIDAIERFYGATAALRRASDDFARLIDDDHWDRVVGMLEDAVAAGASVAFGGQTDADTRYVSPTLLTDVPLDTPVMQEEIFGPLLPIIPVSTLDETLGIVNERPNPLSMYVFSERDSTVETVLGRTTAGTTCVNEGFLHYANPDLPFGGAGHSGIGRGHGEAGFQAFSNERSVLRRRYGASFLRAVFPPFTDRKEGLLRSLLRYFSGP
jgi:aldehyde dehydrogenase (NAD+)